VNEDLAKKGGPAFPVPNYIKSLGTGMTLRDYFAAKALPSCLAALPPMPDVFYALHDGPTAAATAAYLIADAMLKVGDKS
jgi:hypothetical protein